MPAGRPPFYTTPEELQKKIDEYFTTGRTCRTIIIGKEPNKITIDIPVPTVTGLALYLGFDDRQSLYDYQERQEYSCIIKNARTRVEKHYEEMLQTDGGAGIIFALKNMGWKDKTETDLNHNFPKAIKCEIIKT